MGYEVGNTTSPDFRYTYNSDQTRQLTDALGRTTLLHGKATQVMSIIAPAAFPLRGNRIRENENKQTRN